MDNELTEINEACEMAGDLNHYKSKIYEYVESRMTFIAPNITAIVGRFFITFNFFKLRCFRNNRHLLLNKVVFRTLCDCGLNFTQIINN